MSASTAAKKPVKSICHCGDITVTLPYIPEWVMECQCTICRRYATAWGYYESKELEFEQKGEGTKKYVWGDGENEFHWCAHCGCVVYWWRIEPDENGSHKVGVNTRNVLPSEMALVDRRIQFDAVKLPLKDKALRHRDDIAEYE